ncbi:MAG: hypothetical protein H6747_06890, partial [Deltaproteobacteria bacterium]|nr:hypothetical protein [Deltaproteobacteria bacterium]
MRAPYFSIPRTSMPTPTLVRAASRLLLLLALTGWATPAFAVCDQVLAYPSNANFDPSFAAPASLPGVTDFSIRALNLGWVKSDGTAGLVMPNSPGAGPAVAQWSNLAAIAVGDSHVVGLQKDGTVLTAAEQVTVQNYENFIKNLGKGIAVAAGSSFSAIVRNDGTIRCWGSGDVVKEADYASSFVRIVAADTYLAAIRADGSVAVFGTVQTNPAATPLIKAVPQGLVVKQLAAGQSHLVALTATGSVVAWGSNADGESTVPTGLKDVVAVGAGITTSYALQADGTVVAWGGYGVAKTIVDLKWTGVQRLFSAGDSSRLIAFACAGACGPVEASGCCKADGLQICTGGKVVATDCAAGTCGWDAGKSTFACGTKGEAKPGDLAAQTCGCSPDCRGKACGSDGCGGLCGGTACPEAPACGITHGLSNKLVEPAGLTAMRQCGLISDDHFWLTVGFDGTMKAWGVEFYVNQYEPTWGIIAGANKATNVAAIATGSECVAALHKDGTVSAWGNDNAGETKVPTDLKDVVQIAAGLYAFVALQADGTVRAWGDPKSVFGLDGKKGYVGVYGSAGMIGLVKADGTAELFASGNSGFAPELKNAAPANLKATKLAFSEREAVALQADGSLVAWRIPDSSQFAGDPAIVAQAAKIKGALDVQGASNAIGVLTGNGVVKVLQAANAAVPTITTLSGVTGFGMSQSGTNFCAVTCSASCYSVTPLGCCTGDVYSVCDKGQLVDKVCAPGTCGWNPSTGLYGCGTDGSAAPMTEWQQQCPIICKPDCTGKICGDDGCGGSCGECGPGQQCSGKQTDICATAKDGETLKLECPEGQQITGIKFAEYGQLTGSCPVLEQGACDASGEIAWFIAQCVGKQSCSTTDWHVPFKDPCYGDVKTAGVIATCAADGGGQMCACKPNCDGKSCGPDGCGGLCGTCSGDMPCDLATGQCPVCTVGAVGNDTNPPGCISPCGLPTAWGFDALERTAVPKDLKRVKDIAVSAVPTVAVLHDGTLATWGGEHFGIKAGAVGKTGIVTAAASSIHVVAARKDGTVVAWGNNDKGETKVPAGLKDVVAVAAGDEFSAALTGAGTVVTWGSYKVKSANGATGFKAIAAGQDTLAAIRDDGSVFVWGSTSSLKQVPTGLVARQIAVGSSHIVALAKDGTVYAWGSNYAGQTKVPAGLKDVVWVAAGNNASFAVTADGKVTAWGDNTGGQVSNASKLVGVTRLIASKGVGFAVALTCADACGAIGTEGCCQGDTLNTCNALGKKTTSICAAGTCGWDPGAGRYDCATVGTEDPGANFLRQCGGPCTPDCSSRNCGDDGCGGSCGTCQDGWTCPTNGICICATDCAGKACGGDGCGGSCGVCAGDATCDAGGQCICKPKCDGKTCGDDGCGGSCGTCGANQACGEKGTCVACTPDCNGKSCGSDGCGGSCGTCEAGKGCAADGTCTCVPDCDGKTCGDDGCGWYCGFCPFGQTCNPQLQTCCVPDCKGKVCGDNGCGGSCGSCAKGSWCSDSGTCEKGCKPQCDGKSCGPDGCGGTCGTCDAGAGEVCNEKFGGCFSAFCPGTPAAGCCAGESAETCESLSALVPSIKGTRHTSCAAKGQYCGWIAASSSYGCVDTPNPKDPSGTYPRACPNLPVCVPSCAGKTCGTDGCGGSCGSCGASQQCNFETGLCYDDACADLQGGSCCAGQTLYTCLENNGSIQFGKQICASGPGAGYCGWTGSGYGCGTDGAPAPDQGPAKSCPESICKPNCDGKSCGDDGCGGTCGVCGAEKECKYGKCQDICYPEKTCTASFVATSGESITNHYCKQSDGCGGTCACPAGTECKVEGGVGLCKKPKASNCGEITGACCDGQVLKWCSDPGGDAPKQVASIDCLAKGQFCGYQNGDYDCGTETGVDTFLGKPKYCKGAKQTCEPVCSGKECGPDGCGGTCGSCKDGGVCDDGTGKCITSEGCFGAPLLGCCDGNKLMRCIKPAPTSKATTEVDTCVNGCGWSETEGAYSCNPTAGAAPDPNGNVPMACGCVGNCQGKQCGDDGCGGSCGSCAAGTICKNGFKSTDDGYVTQYCKACTASCSGKVCGDDSCGGSCGTCGAGKECDDTGACVDTPPAPTCQNTPWQGSCNGEKLQYCANGKIFVEDCASTLHCGWNPAFGAYSCGTAGGVDPTGQWPKAAPGTKAICVKQCDGRQCGSDGCGGTCGACVGGALCSYNGICVKDENHDPWYPPSGGCCFLAKDGKPAGRITWASGMKYSACSASNGGTECGDNGYGNMVCGVIGSGINAPTAAQTCKECGTCSGKGPCDTNDCGQSCGGCGNGTGLVCNYGTGQCDKQRIQPNSCDGACGDNNPIHPCQCDEKCGERGDCCENYAAYCKVEKPKPNACGDKQCDKAVGETCATCPFDCGKCQVPSGVQPPWASPFAQVTIAAGTAYQSQQNLVGALDNVQPPPPPYPVDGLVGYLPRPGVSAGPPSTVLVEGTATAGGKVEVVPGASGEGFGFFANGQPTGGTVRVLLEQELPRAPYNGSAAPGGYTVAGWFKVPKAAPDVANPLFSMHSDGIHNESRTCTWSRKGDARLKFACPPGPQNLPMTVKQIRAYYGSTQGDGIPNGACSLLDGIHRDYRCNDFGVQAAAEAACIGKPECEIDVGATLGDPCASVSGAEVRIVAQVVCDYADNSANAGLVVIEPSSEGGRLRMVGGMRTTRTAGAPSKDVWHHVAVTYHPYPGTGGLGERTLYLDGLVQGVEHGVPQFRFREIVLGAGPVGDAGPVAVGAGKLSPAVAHLDEFFAYDRALSGVEVRALIDKRDRSVLRAWPNLAAPGVVKDGVGISGGTGFGAAKDLAITEPLLIDPATQGGLVAAQRALGLGKGVSWSSRVADGELAGLKNFTLAGWVRVAEPADGKALLQLLLDGKAEASVAIDKGCDGRAIVGVAGGATTAVPASCEHGVGATQWAFVALVREGKQQSVWIDGYRVGTATLPADAPLFAGATAKQVRSFEVGDGVDLAWAALFGRALGQAELQRWRSTGPAVWLDGARYAKDGLQLRDYANFRNVDGTAEGGRPRLRTANGALLTGSDGNGPLVLGDKGSSSVAAQLTLPLRGRLRAAGANADVQALSWAGRVTLAADAPASVPLLSVDDGGADGKQLANRLHASLVCDRSGGKLACRVDAGGLRDDGKWAVWSSTTRAA